MSTDFRLRIVTMNAQLMSQDAVLNEQAVRTRAELLADAFLNDRWPDVICFNEVLAEIARDILTDKLSGEWPHIAKKFGPTRTLDIISTYNVVASVIAALPTGHPLHAIPAAVAISQIIQLLEIPDDAGIMVFSRYPITGEDFVSYSDYDGTDSLADKGIALVTIERSENCTVNVLASHLQAAYDALDEHADIRASQFKQIESLITSKAIKDQVSPPRAATLVLGDLNIHADRAPRQEWENMYRNGSSVAFFTNEMWDAWEQFISPESTYLTDPGITHFWPEEGWESRLDCVLLRRPEFPLADARRTPPFAVHRMFLVHPGISDHIGVAAEVNLHNPYCCPAQANDKTSVRKGQYDANLEFGGMSWLRFKGKSTWSLTADEHTGFEVYAPDNLTQLLSPRYTTDLREIPDAADAWKRHERGDLNPLSRTFVVIASEFLVRVFRRKDDSGPIAFGFHRHMGTSPADAIGIAPQQEPTSPDFAELASPINPPMTFWYRVQIRRAVSGETHESKFFLENHTGDKLQSRLVIDPTSSSPQELGTQTSDQFHLLHSVFDPRDTAVYWSVTRSQPNQAPFSFRWQSSMNFIIDPIYDPPRLNCVDETGVDVFGGDEITLGIQLDSQGGFITLLKDVEDVDSGESLTIPSAPNGSFRSVDTPFLHHVKFRVSEGDWLGNDTDEKNMDGLPANAYEAAREITLEPGSGTYRMHCRLRREP